LDFIPFVFHSVSGFTFAVERPPLEDVMMLNLSHYRTTADLEQGRFYTSIPVPWVTGVVSKDAKRMTGGVAWIFESDTAKVGMLEFQGQGLSSLETALDKKEHQMAVLGARMLEAAKKAAESTETHILKSTGDGATLTQIVNGVSGSLTQALLIAAWWASTPDTKMEDLADKVKAVLNTDFISQQLQGPQITAIVGAWQAGLMDKRTVAYNFRQGELLAPDDTLDDYVQRLEIESPGMVPVPPKVAAASAGAGGGA
jgi:hypothetical protein